MEYIGNEVGLEDIRDVEKTANKLPAGDARAEMNDLADRAKELLMKAEGQSLDRADMYKQQVRSLIEKAFKILQ